MTLAQQIRELMGRATAGVVEVTRKHELATRSGADDQSHGMLCPFADVYGQNKNDDAALISLLLNNAETLAQAVEAVEAAKVLATEAVLLLNNAEGCARDHYRHDMSLYGLPGWLADSRERIMTARKALPTPPTKEDQNDDAAQHHPS